jgi:hypothetical protein
VDLDETAPLSDATAGSSAGIPPEDSDGFSVLQAFGLELKVSNRHLAELLTMEAGDALTTDLGKLGSSAGNEAEEYDAAQIAAHAAQDERRAERRRQLNAHVAQTGEALGFDVGPGNVWHSQSGMSPSAPPQGSSRRSPGRGSVSRDRIRACCS